MASKMYQVISMVDGQPTFKVELPLILAECSVGGAIKILTPDQYHTDQQRNWWKGILLPALENDTGEARQQWEMRLKFAVMPDDFSIQIINVNGLDIASVPSITTLGKRKMSELIDGSIRQLHVWGFGWVEHPDPERRR